METWKEVRDFPGYFVNKNGDIKGKMGKVLKPSLVNGYKFVILRRNNKSYMRQIHRIVATTFIENQNKLPIVNHKDENKLNNRVDNLEWCTYSYNNTYGTKVERTRRTRIKNKKTCKKVVCVETGMVYDSIKEAACDLNIFSGDISRACKGSIWRNTCGGYHWEYV